jgi:hypothetical protein
MSHSIAAAYGPSVAEIPRFARDRGDTSPRSAQRGK